MKKKAKKKKIRHEIQTEYLGKVYGKEFLTLVPQVVKKLRAIKKEHPFDAIAFTGSSGAALAYPLSFLLKMPLIHVRKSNDNFHYSRLIEGTISSKRYIIVDDFIETGKSIKRIIKSINQELKKSKAKPAAICLYSECSSKSIFNYYGRKIPIFTVKNK